ncbi:hypothetical protein [Streptomyces sp. 6N223]|uniref:hypothetical protein n=1 Tax=Streptomyces sp. 6N223 TaxID=3457412 RepID=UPI003FD2002C
MRRTIAARLTGPARPSTARGPTRVPVAGLVALPPCLLAASPARSTPARGAPAVSDPVVAPRVPLPLFR